MNGNDAFLVSDMSLDCKPYNNTQKDVTWEKSTLRSWLNGYASSYNIDNSDYSSNNFINTAFTLSENAAIKVTSLENTDSPKFNTSGGNNTEDKIFLLGIEDVKNSNFGFSDTLTKEDDSRKAKASAYAREINKYGSYIGACLENWILRTPGRTNSYSDIVYFTGASGGSVDVNLNQYIRPALHIDLSSKTWEYAGTVTSEIYYTYTFDSNGGECDTTSISLKYKSNNWSLPKATKEGSCFRGWSVDKADRDIITQTTNFYVEEDRKFYANWSENHGTQILRNQREATCGTVGYTGDYYCSICDEILVSGNIIPTTGNHNCDEIIEAVAPTCVKEGTTEGKKCSVCGTVTEKPQTVSANGHICVDIEAKPATCTESGATEGKKCSVCGLVTEEPQIVIAKGHTWLDNASKAATCTEDGYEGGQHCKNCSATQGEVKTLTKLGHDFDKTGTVTKEPTLREEGETTHKCSRCDATEKRPIAKLVEEGKEIVGTPETKTNEDGTVTTVEKHKDDTTTEKTNVEVTITGDTKTKVELVVDKDSSDKITNTEVKIETTGKPEFTQDLVNAVKEMVADKTATTLKKANPEITLVTRDASGNDYSITATAKDIKKNAKLTVYAIDPVTGELILTDEGKLKCDKQGALETPSLSGDKDYKLLSTKEASKALKAIKKTIALSEKTGQVEAGGTYTIKLDDGYNPVNIKDIDYSISAKKGSVDKATGVVTLNPSVTKGNVSVKVTVTLTDGSKVKLTQKIKIKK